jgi:hypothetical protein
MPLTLLLYSLTKYYPPNMQTTKSKIWGVQKGIKQKDGPGDSPAIPHPAPNNPAPIADFNTTFTY